jgi:hypothetical protein
MRYERLPYARHGPHTAYRIPHTAYAIPISINADPQSAFCFRITSDFAFCSLVLHSSISDLRCSMAWPFALRHVCGPSLERLGDQPGQQLPTGEILAHFQANNARSAPFFCVYVGMSLVNDISARFFSRRQICGPAQLLRAGVGERKWVNGGMVSDSRSLLSAGGCLVVTSSKHCGPVWRQAQLTGAIGLSSAAVVEKYYVAHLACCLMQ